MWWKSKPDVEFQYGGHLGEFNGMSSQSHVSHCRVLPLGEFTVTIPEPHSTLQGVRIQSAILKIVSPCLFFFCFQCSLGFDERQLSYRLRYTCYNDVVLLGCSAHLFLLLLFHTIILYSSLFTENGSNYTVIAKQTAGLNKLNYTNTIMQPIYNAWHENLKHFATI